MADENAEPNCCRLETVLVRRRPPRAGREHPRVPPAPTRVLGHDALQETIKSHGTLPTDEVLRGAPAEELVRMMDCEALQGQYLALLLAAAFGEPTLGHACSGRLGPRRTGIDSLPLRRARASLLSVCVCVCPRLGTQARQPTPATTPSASRRWRARSCGSSNGVRFRTRWQRAAPTGSPSRCALVRVAVTAHPPTRSSGRDGPRPIDASAPPTRA